MGEQATMDLRFGGGGGGERLYIFFGTEEAVPSPDAVYQVFFVDFGATTFLVNGRFRDLNWSFWFGCPALGCGPRVALLLRWSHSCLFVECPYFVSHLSSSPNVPFSVPLTLLLFLL